MKKQPQHSHSNSKAKPIAKSKAVASKKEIKPIGPPFFERFETFAIKNEKWIMFIIFGLSVICSILLFDLKVSIGGDDSAYVERAYNFLMKGVYPYYQSPGYPLVIAGLMKVFGYKIGVFKVFSLLFYTAHIVLTWFTFRKKLPYLILIFMVGFAAVSDYMQYYASQTWSEAFFMFVQAVLLWLVMKAVSIEKQEGNLWHDFKKRWYLWLGIGLAFTYLTMTKTVAVVSIGAPLLYFILQKKYRFAIYIVLSFVVIKLGVGQLEKSMYGPNNSKQWDQMMLKDSYHPEYGRLDTGGVAKVTKAFANRFGENLKTYSGMHFFRIVHVIPQNKYKLSEEGVQQQEENNAGWMVTVFMALLIGVASIFIYRENKQVFFLVLYALIMCGGIFLGIHANNRQDRLIIIIFPFILMIIAYGGYLMAKKFRIIQGIFTAVLAVVLLAGLYNTLAKAPESIAILEKNMGNEPYYGYTQDWVNYLEMGDWCVENLPLGSKVACRKPEILFTNTRNQMWYGIYKIDDEEVVENGKKVKRQITDGDYWLNKLKDAKVTHILVADLRAIPTKKTNRLISTIHKIGNFIVQKYPNKLRLIKVIGTEERSALYEINY